MKDQNLSPDLLFPDLFEAVQVEGVFPDSKTFVDCCPKYAPKVIVNAYQKGKNNPDFDLRLFVLAHFELPKDFSSGFKHDPSLSASEHVEALWPFLSRKGGSTKIEGDSLIPIPFDYIVPGGRFGEIYYWDSYFTMLGLAVNGKVGLIENMVKNFAYFIETFGHIPNGNRTYFLSRSQPPFFAYMVQLLSGIMGPGVMDEFIPSIEREYRFWMFGARYIPQWGVNRYWDAHPLPRQESYKEDVELAESSSRPPADLYRHLRAACESGWDFASRWLGDGRTMETIEAADIIPVDLNALLYGIEDMLIQYYKVTGRSREERAIEMNQRRRKYFMNYHCWNEKTGIYHDYHLQKKTQTGVLSLATVYPLFVGMCDREKAVQIGRKIESHFLKAGGLLSTLHHTGQQWDAPNGWAPLQWLAVKGLMNYGHHDLAKEIAVRWTRLNESVYKNTGKFVEKYNVEDIHLKAGGGEYPVQDGFGWSNGVYLALKNEVMLE